MCCWTRGRKGRDFLCGCSLTQVNVVELLPLLCFVLRKNREEERWWYRRKMLRAPLVSVVAPPPLLQRQTFVIFSCFFDQFQFSRVSSVLLVSLCYSYIPHVFSSSNPTNQCWRLRTCTDSSMIVSDIFRHCLNDIAACGSVVGGMWSSKLMAAVEVADRAKSRLEYHFVFLFPRLISIPNRCV